MLNCSLEKGDGDLHSTVYRTLENGSGAVLS